MKESVCRMEWGFALCTPSPLLPPLPAPEGGQQEFELWPKNSTAQAPIPRLREQALALLRRTQARVGEEARYVPGLWELPFQEGRLGETPTESEMVSMLLILTGAPGVLFFTNGRLRGETQCAHCAPPGSP